MFTSITEQCFTNAACCMILQKLPRLKLPRLTFLHRSLWPGDVWLRRWLATREVASSTLLGSDIGLYVLHTNAPFTKEYTLVPVVGQRCPAVGKVTRRRSGHTSQLKWFIHLQALVNAMTTPTTFLIGCGTFNCTGYRFKLCVLMHNIRAG